ncbi:MAG: DUF4115 domain-containing protein [Alphaproteobacteria bacterium]|nr:DUF4115 domain-containing protein [Alphaproteobacteria bacterium]
MNENNVEMTAAEMLRNARTTGRRKREIPTIAKQLCIREEFLEALESGNYHQIPELVYVLGFARNYAMELGLNPEEIVTKIKREMGLLPDVHAAGDKNDEETVAPAGAVKRGGFWARMLQFGRKYWMWLTAGLVALVILVVGLTLALRPAAETDTPVVVDTPVMAVSEPAYKLAVRERFGTENRESADVILQAAQESWVKIEDGRGNTVFSRVLVPGDVYYVPAGDKYKGTFGNAGGIDVWVDGKLGPKLGADHTRKSGVSMAPASLMATAGTTAE